MHQCSSYTRPFGTPSGVRTNIYGCFGWCIRGTSRPGNRMEIRTQKAPCTRCMYRCSSSTRIGTPSGVRTNVYGCFGRCIRGTSRSCNRMETRTQKALCTPRSMLRIAHVLAVQDIKSCGH
eukprot:gene14084-biopygen3832